LEITEHERIRDYNVLANILAEYRAEGIRFALDDVGEGHSTLELLAASASEFLKLGRSLTMTSTRVGSRAAMDATMAFARVSAGPAGGAQRPAAPPSRRPIPQLARSSSVRQSPWGRPTHNRTHTWSEQCRSSGCCAPTSMRICQWTR